MAMTSPIMGVRFSDATISTSGELYTDWMWEQENNIVTYESWDDLWAALLDPKNQCSCCDPNVRMIKLPVDEAPEGMIQYTSENDMGVFWFPVKEGETAGTDPKDGWGWFLWDPEKWENRWNAKK